MIFLVNSEEIGLVSVLTGKTLPGAEDLLLSASSHRLWDDWEC